MARFDARGWNQGTARAGAAFLLLISCALNATEPEPNDDLLKIPMWSYSGELRGGLGYKDNVLLSHTNPTGSSFWMSGAEGMLFRLPTRGWQFHLFADATDTRYFDAESVDSEQVALVVAQLSKQFQNAWKSSWAVNYMYQNQVFDNSANYADQASVGQIVGHTLTPRFALRKGIAGFWLEGEFLGTRQWLEEPLDDYWQYGPRAVFGYGWGRGSELALAYQPSRLDYDHREQVDQSGSTVTNSLLSLDIHLVELSLTHVWDARRCWQTITALGYEASRDNGSGFFDYNSYRVIQKVRFRHQKWDISLRARLSFYDYPVQTVSATDTELRSKTLLSITLRAERVLTKHLKAHVSYGWDRSLSNLEFDDYESNVVLGGLAITF